MFFLWDNEFKLKRLVKAVADLTEQAERYIADM
jgi:hypothetical protein